MFFEDARMIAAVEPTWVWGVPMSPVTMTETIAEIELRIDERQSSYLVSANLNYAMLCDTDQELQAINRQAALVLVDGMPLVWASRFQPKQLRERVAGSDLIFAIAELAASRNFSIYFLGGSSGVAGEAAKRLRGRYPGLVVAGTESPPFGPMSEETEEAILGRIRSSGADILIAAFSQPRGEKWIAANYEKTGAPVCLQIGAALDFAAGRVRRAPQWVRRGGLEWAFRLALEPRRLAGRYARNTAFLVRSLLRDLSSRSRFRADKDS
jgi:N-acetylglucosaminyldiphosphoundecaprenol N-acetyl-beta-D-mannosaminyltransferase